jgi:phosphoserine phosphatase RsbU/P
MKSLKNMTLALLEYEAGSLSLSGQHEELIIARANGAIEQIDTFELGFPLGLEADITSFVNQATVHLETGDVAVLYTDGITEAMNTRKEQYGLEPMYKVLKQTRQLSAQDIRSAVIDNLRHHIGAQKVFDDITLVVLKRK